MLEAKAKDLALLRLREQLSARGIELRPRAGASAQAGASSAGAGARDAA